MLYQLVIRVGAYREDLQFMQITQLNVRADFCFEELE